ncbi:MULTISPECIES: CPBP family intramembrane glutamic endopeptidase [unclassified Marinitoga]|uniref:CPBP family intramembrane glutamic endopeptidase n=1 Tax=unclassified Marinitoga TaxID=2640159 RepID=UPI0006410165|nr:MULTISPECIES: CPBP family intramembrane glutamic endopeptidase [unclassified Marinitoga]KLO23982.1 hypothetical protein X274_05575 [Marinitoga sp. 1155]NUU99173.1 hypothetical protein [Marinitoga sp. 1154]
MNKKISFISFFIVLFFSYLSAYYVFFSNKSFYTMLILMFFISFLSVILKGDFNIKVNMIEIVMIFWISILLYFMFWIFRFIVNFFEIFREEIESFYYVINNQKFLAILMIVFFISLFEEIIWRGFISKFIIDKVNNPIIALLLSSLLYAFIYIPTQNVILILSAFIIGFIFSFAYYITGNVAVSIYTHIIWLVLVIIIIPLR